VGLANQPDNQTDEVNKFIMCRYVSPPEAMWRLHERSLYEKSHTIERLPIHLPQQQLIYFQLNAGDVNLDKDSKLTAFFKLCESNDTAKGLLYSEIPENFVWNKNQWNPRKRHSKCIGRIYTVSPADRERFSLRLLLLNVRGPTSYESLKTVDGTVYNSFAEAAIKMNLLQNDQEWERCLEEAVTFQMPRQLRDLFAVICVFGTPQDIPQLWETFKTAMSEDYLRQYDEETAFNLALIQGVRILVCHSERGGAAPKDK